MIKALFFDIDGTLVSFRTHTVPQSAVEAIAAARESGVKVFISTGRPFQLINNLAPIKDLIDGYITVNGAYCFVGRRTVACLPIPQSDVDKMLRMARELDFACMMVGEKDISMFNSNAKAGHIFHDLLNLDDYGQHTPIERLEGQKILQMSPIVSAEEELRLMDMMTDVESGRWSPDFTDMTAKGVNKGEGLKAIAAFEGLDLSQTMAFGDGGNDVPIVSLAGVGVAMGNGGEGVKRVADFVTASVDDDGVKIALQHFGVIA